MNVMYDKILGKLREGGNGGGGGSAAGGEIKILCIGNSNTQDSFGYLPFVLKSVNQNVELTIGLAFIGQSGLAQHLAYATAVDDAHKIEYYKYYYYVDTSNTSRPYIREIIADGTINRLPGYEYFKSVNGGEWSRAENRLLTPINGIETKDIISDEEWDLIVLQDSGASKVWYSATAPCSAPYLYPMQKVLAERAGKGVKFGWLSVAVPSDTQVDMIAEWTGQHTLAKNAMQQAALSVLFSPSSAVQGLRTISAFQQLGRNGNLAYDNAHLQEGLGPLCAAYHIAATILNMMGLEYQSVIGDTVRPNLAWITANNIPGTHPAEPTAADVIGITNYNCLLAQVAAVNAAKYPYKVINPTLQGDGDDRIVAQVDEFVPAPEANGTAGQVLQLNAEGKPEWVTPSAGTTPDSELSNSSTNSVQNKVVTAALENKANTEGTYENLVAGDLISLGDRVTIAGIFTVRPTANDAHIDSSADALLLQLKGGCGEVEADSFKIHSILWNGTNQLDPSAWAVGKTTGYITGEVAQGVIGSGQHKLCIIHCPKCEVGNYGTAEKNNGYLLTSSNGVNLKVGDGTIIGVWYSAAIPAAGTEVTAVTEHTFSGHPEKFYIPEEGYMIVEVPENADLAAICAHLAWSKEYDKFTAYVQPNELTLAVSPLTSVFETATINGETCIVLRGIESGIDGIFDNVIIHSDGGGTYERNIAPKLLTELTWTETVIEIEGSIDERPDVIGYRYTANLPTTGTYAAMRDGLIRSDIDGMVLDGLTLSYDSAEQIAPATAFAGKYVDYQIATPVSGTHSINPTGKKPDDMGTEEVIGGSNPTGTIVISYMRGFRDTMRALYTDFKVASAKLDLMNMHSPLYCVGEWLENAHTASPNDQDNPDALAVFGNREWALDWRPFLVDMTAVEGETKKRPVMELRKNNWLRDIYGNWAPVVGITTAMRDECMAKALYWDNMGNNLYCAAGEYDPEAFLERCQMETVDSVKKLTHPKLYKSVRQDETITYEEVAHYLMPWETTETKYSIFVGRKDEVYLLDNLVGASGKEWNGIIGANVNFWDGVDVKVYALKPTGICPGPVTGIVENGVSKSRSFFFNYAATDGSSKGYTGASGCTMFRDNGHYHTINISQIGTKSRARANNHDSTAPFPVAEGGFHARNAFLRCVETALGTKNLCVSSRFSSGVTSVDACSNETQWLANGGIRYKESGGIAWEYRSLSGNPAMYYGSGETKTSTNGNNWLSGYGPLSKTLEAQIAVSFAVEFGVEAGERFEFNGSGWWYMNPTATGFSPKTVADGYMNARVYKIVTGTYTGYSSANATETTEFDVEVCVRVGLMLGCDMSGDGGPYWGGGCEVLGECATAPASGSFGYELKAYIEPDQARWTNESDTSVNIGQQFSFESRYKYAGSIVTRSDGYTRRRLPNTPLPAVRGGGYQKGECGYSYMANYWGSAGKKTRVGVRSGPYANSGGLSARYLNASNSAGYAGTYFCGSAQVLLDVQ